MAEFTILKQGQLHKLNSRNKWQQRWFVLDSQHIQYFANLRSVSTVDKTRTVAKWKSRIAVGDLSFEEQETQGKVALELKGSGSITERLVLGFSNTEERALWCSAIAGAKELLSGSTVVVETTVEGKSLTQSRMSMNPTQPAQEAEAVAEGTDENEAELPDTDLYVDDDEESEEEDTVAGGDDNAQPQPEWSDDYKDTPEKHPPLKECTSNLSEQGDVATELPVLPVQAKRPSRRATMVATDGIDDIFRRMQELELQGKHTEAAELMASAYVTAQRNYMQATDPSKITDETEHENPHVLERNHTAKVLRKHRAEEMLDNIPAYQPRERGESQVYDDTLTAELNNIEDVGAWSGVKVNFGTVGAKQPEQQSALLKMSGVKNIF